MSEYRISRMKMILEHAAGVYKNPARTAIAICKGIALWKITEDWGVRVVELLNEYFKNHPEHDARDLPEPTLDNFPQIFIIDGGDEWMKTWKEIKSIPFE